MSGDRDPAPSIPWWARLPLALAAFGGLAVLARSRPPLPSFLAEVRPTAQEELRETVVFVAWLLLALIAVAFAWCALRPPWRSHREPEPEPEPPLLPAWRRREPPLPMPRSSELLALFATPRPAAQAGPPDPERAVPEPPEADPIGPGERPLQTPSAPRLLRLFGPLAIDGDTAGLAQRATRGLIVYLVLKGGAASAGELLEALWPGEEPATVRGRLWKARIQAQQLLGEVLQRGHDGYRIDRRALPTDSDEVQRIQQEDPDPERLAQAIALIRGEPLADTDYPWAENERRRLQGLAADMLTQAAAARLAGGDASGALAAAERLLELGPFNEQAVRLAMSAEAALGQRQAILERYQRFSRELDGRLGLRPASETRETYRRLLGQD